MLPMPDLLVSRDRCAPVPEEGTRRARRSPLQSWRGVGYWSSQENVPLSVARICLWPIHQALTDRLREALVRTGAACRPGETWDVSVYEGPEVEGTVVAISGQLAKRTLTRVRGSIRGHS